MNRAMLPSTAASRLQRAIHPKDPDAALREIPLFAPPRLRVQDEFPGVIDDSPVLVDRFGGKYAVAVQPRPPADDPRELRRFRHGFGAALSHLARAALIRTAVGETLPTPR